MGNGYVRTTLRGLLAAALFFGLALAGPQDNSLVIASSQEPNVIAGDFLAVLNNLAVSSEIAGYHDAPLIGLDLSGENFPVLVTELPTVQNGRVKFTDVQGGKKRLEINLTLKENLKWSDGQALDTDDIAFYYEVGKAPGMPVGNPDYWDRVGLKVSDKRNFTVTFEPASAVDLIGSPMGLAPQHAMRAEWEKAKASVKGLDLQKDAEKIAEAYRSFFAAFSNPQAINTGRMVYSGPFRVSRWVPGSTLELVRNPNFSALTPPGGADKYVQRVAYRFFKNTNSLLVAVLGGGVDVTSSAGLDFDQARAPQLVQRAPGRFDIWVVPGAIWEHILLNNYSNVPRVKELGLDDKRTRQAIILAMNRQGLVQSFFGGLQPVANTWMPPSYTFYNPKARAYAYNFDQARQLLSQMGWRPGADGILQRTMDGKTVRFELEFATTAGRALRERVQQFLADNLKQVGIAVKINNAPTANIVDDKYLPRGSTGAWTGGIMIAQFFAPQTLEGDLFACKNLVTGQQVVANEANGFGGANDTGWCSDEYDRLYSQVLYEFDPTKRKAAFARMQEIFAEEVPYIPLYWRTASYVTRKGLVNYVASTFSGGLGIPNWAGWNIGWESRGAQKLYDQAQYAQTPK